MIFSRCRRGSQQAQAHSFRNPSLADDPGAGTVHRHRNRRRNRHGQDELLHVPFRGADSRLPCSDKEKKIGGLVLEVKGDFCHKVREILDRHGRAEDYIEIGLGSEYRYNPLQQ